MARIHEGESDQPLERAISEKVALSEMFGDGPWWAHLTRIAKRLASLQPEMGVVSAQMAVEVWVEEAIRSALVEQGLQPEVTEAVIRCLPDRSLMSRRTRDLWLSLTGDAISKAAPWKNYQRHIELRNVVVHGGTRVTQEQARQSLEVCIDLIRHMRKTLGVHVPMPKTVLVDPGGDIAVVFGHIDNPQLETGWSAFNVADDEIVEQLGATVSRAVYSRVEDAASRPVGWRGTATGLNSPTKDG